MITLHSASLLALILPDTNSALLRIAATSILVPLVPLVFIVLADAWRGAFSARRQPRAPRVLPRREDRRHDPHELVFRSGLGAARVLARLNQRRLGSQLRAVGSIRALTGTDGKWFGQRGVPN